MCGIVGILSLIPSESVDQARLKLMRDVLRHRGPDGDGLLIDGPVGLGHRRLAIVDVAGGHQPMPNEDETVWIVYNGEVYNHAALRPPLEARGHRYRTRSDTETILHLYEEDGERCVERLQGMFAFALWDRARGRLFLARDRLGIKPLYYAVTPYELLFASEIKAILAARRARPSFNDSVLPQFLATGFVSGEETFFRGIQKLPPGHTLTWSVAEGLRHRRYWRLPTEIDDAPATLEQRASELRARLETTVRSHLMSDVPLGLFLSGGVDSSGLAALMAPMADRPIRTFAVGFSEPEGDERPYARAMARAVGAEHRDVVVSHGEFLDALPHLIWQEDKPIAFPSSIPLYFVSRLAREHVKVVLTGEGADELFLGYPWYRATAWNERLGRAYWALAPQRFRRRVRALTGRLPKAVRRYADRSFLALDPGPRSLFYENFAAFPTALQSRLLTEPSVLAERDPYAEALRCYEEAPGGTLARMSHADLQTYVVELLARQDAMSMAASIESRVPYLDHELVEHVVAMPARFKLRGWRTKAVLKTALRPLLPPEILARRKMGFVVPFNRWFRGPFWPVVQEFVLGSRTARRGLFSPSALQTLAEEHRAGAAEHGPRLWLLVNLEIWQRIFIDGEDPAAIVGARSLGRVGSR
jgi:asparagine synthase (glutamine-hydrolysing)